MIIAIAVLAVCDAAPVLRAEAIAVPAAASATSSEVERYVALYLQRERLAAECEVLASETQFLRADSAGAAREPEVLQALVGADPQIRPLVNRLLAEGLQPMQAGLTAAATAARQRSAELAAAWTPLRDAVAAGEVLLLKVRASRQLAGKLAALLSFDKRWFWFFGAVAVGMLLLLVLHDRRHELRRWLYGGRARALGLSKFLAVALLVLVLLTLVTFCFGDRLYLWVLRSGSSAHEAAAVAAVPDSLAELERQVAGLTATRDKQLEQVRQLWRETPAAESPAALSVAFRAQLAALLVEQTVAARLAAVVAEEQAHGERLQAELADNTQATTMYLRLKHVIRGMLGLSLLGLTIGGGVAYRRGLRQRRQQRAQICPLCLGHSSLKFDGDPAGAASTRFVKCSNVLSEHPYELCDYRFAAGYRTMPKLCIPTLGVPQAGKTHWLATVYWQLSRGNYPPVLGFQKVKSQSSEDYDLLVDEILSSRLGTAATQRQRIPHPLVFNCRDRDWLGRSNLLVNMFDYSGEVTSDMGVDDYRRRRALEADGYLFFIDPTYPSEPQARALANFREDLRQIKGIKNGRTLRIPVALCMSKIDLLVNRGHVRSNGDDAIAWFYDELARIDPTGESLSLAVLEQRSRLVSQLRETFWPGWEIERQVEELFGRRHLFFPLTPVGIDGRGETDLSQRTIGPFGLLEPLLWLLHMNGHMTLE